MLIIMYIQANVQFDRDDNDPGRLQAQQHKDKLLNYDQTRSATHITAKHEHLSTFCIILLLLWRVLLLYYHLRPRSK